MEPKLIGNIAVKSSKLNPFGWCTANQPPSLGWRKIVDIHSKVQSEELGDYC